MDKVLCVDLDGCLVRTDLLYESLLLLLRRNPAYLLLLPFWLLGGKAHLKAQIARRIELDPATLPYDPRVLEAVRASRRTRVLCTAADARLAGQVAAHLGLFDEVVASDGTTNLGGREKARVLVERYGVGGFDYIGNHHVDLHVWRHANEAWIANAPDSLARRAAAVSRVGAHWPGERRSLLPWIKAIRLHQWLKNLLVFVPLLAAHRVLDPVAASQAVLAFLAFGLCASGAYLVNDLLDLHSDRQHPRKQRRPFASGRLPILHGLLAAPLLTLGGGLLAWLAAPAFVPVLLLYWLTTLGYSLWFKRIEMLDVTVLAGLYTLRIIGGAVAVGVPLSFWLLAFSMFIFLSLAILKRYTELAALVGEGRARASGRGYAIEDLPLLQSLGGAAGYIAVLVLALYINSSDSVALYSRPQALWLLCPLLLYWVSRAWALAHRGRMHDDPVVFAATDRVSLLVAALCGVVLLVAL
ncbi:UbiA family prenyltransferase [Pseudoxanthomonas sp. 10H]|uniref:UbiA family prenyltransferase n=1 Tax=Pseudoxanthomonas sp. 10H TaxID=3242729 RepID=UPI0035563D4F